LLRLFAISRIRKVDMEYEPEQIELLIHKVASTLGNRLEGLLRQQQNILDNQLNQIMMHHDGQADSITPDEIIGAYEIFFIKIYQKTQLH